MGIALAGLTLLSALNGFHGVLVPILIMTYLAFQMPFIQHDHMVEQIVTAAADPALGDAVLPRVGWRESQVQYNLKPARCHRTTVSG